MPLLLIALFLVTAPQTDGVDAPVRTVEAFHRAVAAARPGDVITLADGTWRDAHLVFDADGLEGDTITVRAETPGGVVLTGTSTLRLGGRYLKVDGLWFHRGALDDGHVIAFRTDRPAHHSRLTNTVITEYNPPNWLTGYKWVSLYGTHNRVDHCYLAGKTHDGTTLVVWLEDPPEDRPNDHRIDHNHFGHRPPLGKNGGETIRIGTSHRSMQDSRTVVEHNLFERTDGEHEIISNKSGENVFRHNTFLEAQGALTLRHGNRAVVEHNFFLGNDRPGTGGVRVIGEDHRVAHNYFARLQGDSSRAALSVMNGVPDSPLNRYFQVKGAVIARNTFIDTRVTILYGLGADDEKSLPPSGVTFSGNVVRTGSAEAVVRAMVGPEGIAWSGNVFDGPNAGLGAVDGIHWADPLLEAGADGLWRPRPEGPAHGKGAALEGRPLGTGDVGPAWWRAPWTPRVLTDTTVHLPDFSYAGYHWGERTLPTHPATLDVTDFGATGDDAGDDTAALQRAFDAAHAADGPVVLRLPPGRFHVSDILFIERGHFVLQGSGSGEDGTVLVIEKPLGALSMPPALEAVRRDLADHGKVENGRPVSPFSRTGGLLWTRLPAPHAPEVLTDITGGTRGGHHVQVADAGSLAPGDVVRVAWFNEAGDDAPLLHHVYAMQGRAFGERLWANPEAPLITQDVTVTAVEGRTLTIKEPLLHDLRAAWRPRLLTAAYLEEVGIEHLRIAFEEVPYGGHHLEDGYNALYLTDLRHGWVRDLHVHNADAGILSDRAAHVTLQDLAFTGRTSHYSVHLGDVHHVLVRDFRADNPSLHPLSFNTGSRASVFTRGFVRRPSLDQHHGLNHQNLFDDLTLVEDRDHSPLFEHGGAADWGPTHGAFNTFWNVRLELQHPEEVRLPAYLGAVEDGGAARIVGLWANVPVRFAYGPDAYVEGVNRPRLAVPSLYRHQLTRRLGALSSSSPR